MISVGWPTPVDIIKVRSIEGAFGCMISFAMSPSDPAISFAGWRSDWGMGLEQATAPSRKTPIASTLSFTKPPSILTLYFGVHLAEVQPILVFSQPFV